MDQNTLTTLRGNVDSANTESTNLQTSIPSMLTGLKSNLSSIFTKDNPMFAARDNALNTFLNAPSQTRADLLPENQPVIGGSHLNFSPTQQNAQVTAARNAALVPLAGLNQSIVGQSGNLNDMLGNAATLFQSQADIAKQRASNALNIYKSAIDEYNAVTSRKNAGAGIGDLGSILSGFLTPQTNQRPPLEMFEQQDNTPQNIDIPGQGTLQPYTPASTDNWLSGVGDWWNGLWNHPNNGPQPTSSLNLLGLGSNMGPFKQ